MLLLETVIAPFDETEPAEAPPLIDDIDIDPWEVAGRLLAWRAVSLNELNAARIALGRKPYLTECRCPYNGRAGLCSCGFRIWHKGIREHSMQLLLDRAHEAMRRDRAEAEAACHDGYGAD